MMASGEQIMCLNSDELYFQINDLAMVFSLCQRKINYEPYFTKFALIMRKRNIVPDLIGIHYISCTTRMNGSRLYTSY